MKSERSSIEDRRGEASPPTTTAQLLHQPLWSGCQQGSVHRLEPIKRFSCMYISLYQCLSQISLTYRRE